jgi:hypothetical protein
MLRVRRLPYGEFEVECNEPYLLKHRRIAFAHVDVPGALATTTYCSEFRVSVARNGTMRLRWPRKYDYYPDEHLGESFPGSRQAAFALARAALLRARPFFAAHRTRRICDVPEAWALAYVAIEDDDNAPLDSELLDVARLAG